MNGIRPIASLCLLASTIMGNAQANAPGDTNLRRLQNYIIDNAPLLKVGGALVKSGMSREEFRDIIITDIDTPTPDRLYDTLTLQYLDLQNVVKGGAQTTQADAMAKLDTDRKQVKSVKWEDDDLPIQAARANPAFDAAALSTIVSLFDIVKRTVPNEDLLPDLQKGKEKSLIAKLQDFFAVEAHVSDDKAGKVRNGMKDDAAVLAQALLKQYGQVSQEMLNGTDRDARDTAGAPPPGLAAIATQRELIHRLKQDGVAHAQRIADNRP